MPGALNFALFGHAQDVINWVFESQIPRFGKLRKGKETTGLTDFSALIDDKALVSKTLLPSSPDVLTTSTSTNSLHSKEPGVRAQSVPLAFFDSSPVQSLTSTKEINALQVEESEEEIASDLELPTLVGNIHLGAASVYTNNSPAEVKKCDKANDENGQEGKTVNGHVFLGGSGRKELYMFYEANEPLEKSMVNSHTFQSFSPRASLVNKNKYHSLSRNCAPKGSELSTRVSLQSAGNAMEDMKVMISFVSTLFSVCKVSSMACLLAYCSNRCRIFDFV